MDSEEILNPFFEKLRIISSEIEKRKKVESVCIVGATKSQTPELIQSAVEGGVIDLGVNYVQEGEILQKYITQAVQWHFIGHIQSRKVKYLSHYHYIQSLDRLEVALKLEKHLQEVKKSCKVLVEVNIGGEASKSGISVSDLGTFLKGLKELPSLQVKGLMVMPPPLSNISERRPFFKMAKTQFDTFRSEYGLDTLSMGTSEDYLVAVEEGSNMVRLGTTLFGKRRVVL